MSKKQKLVLLSWLAFNNDPYERDRNSREFILVDGKTIPGPTLTLLFDETSPYFGLNQAIFLRQISKEGKKVAYLSEQAILEGNKHFQFDYIDYHGEDPTDHSAIFSFLQNTVIPHIHQCYPEEHLIVHISPGTGTMQTLWILIVETGMITNPCTIVKSYRMQERHGRGAVSEVSVGLETFYKAFAKSNPSGKRAIEQNITWSPSYFQTIKLKEVYKQAAAYAKLKIPVLITGERGTGKTTMATWIRANSPFRQEKNDRAWAAVPCGQYNSETMRSELFGYNKGAFTGADKNHDGLLTVANNDTLFLDEIGDISKDLQRLLIKVIEEKSFQPLGSTEYRHSDFRLLSATNRSWEELEKKLDADFFDRISFLKLELPPLREIPLELPWLWQTVWFKAIDTSEIQISKNNCQTRWHCDLLKLLKKHPLPGNMRDLFRLAYNALVFLDGTTPELSPKELIEKSLGPTKNLTTSTIARQLAELFALNQSFGDVLQTSLPLQTKFVEKEFKRYLAKEILQFARTNQMSFDDLCDVSERSLRSWLK